MDDFAPRLIAWHRQHGRHDLPWQQTRDPYRVWLSEIMLQQTQVATVIPYYARFLDRFPTLADLAAAPVAEVMALWSGLGYYARARNLHACARVVVSEHRGAFPRQPEALSALPGIGRSTANAIATFCFGARAPILDGNVKRVFCRVFGIAGFPGSATVEKRLWQLAHELMPAQHGDVYNQAQMDLGATLCTRSKPRCGECPFADSCVARRDGRTAELPQKKPGRAIPERAAQLLVVRDAMGRVLLETRPPAGIWGGLQSLPELPEGMTVEQWLRRYLGIEPIAGSVPEPSSALHSLGPATGQSGALPVSVAVSPAPTFTHVFTHFRLRITPLCCEVADVRTLSEPGWQWHDAASAARAALPAPVRTILSQTGLLAEESA